MRTFEIILLVAVTILPFVKRKLLLHIRTNHLLPILGCLLLIHLLFEGWRWQMIPAYILLVLLAWRITAADPAQQPQRSFARILGFAGIAFLALVAWLLPAALPVFTLPEPTGTYPVGTRDMVIKTEKEEVITKEPGDTRELLVKIWYPGNADVSHMNGERYVDQASREGFATKYGLPASALNYLGYGSKATGYYAILAELASHGYVIINMNHTYESLGVSYPDGRKAYFDYGYQQEISEGSMSVIEPVIEVFKNGLAYDKRHTIVANASKAYFEGQIQDRWADDILYTMNLLEKWNDEGWLHDKLDLERIGVFGHSVGGGTAGNVAIRDSRVKAAANLDGIQWGKMIDTVYQIPYLYVSADWPAEHEDINSHVYINKSTDYFYEAKLLNSGHANFMDIPFMVPVSALAGTGDIDPYEGNEIVTNLLTAFFDKHLKESPDAQPEILGQQYGMLEMKIYRGDSLR